MNEYLPGLVSLVVLLAVNAFFVGAEFAVISARRSQIEPRAAAGDKAAKTTLWAMGHATSMLAATQLGITICSLVILNVSEPAIHHLVVAALGWTELSPQTVTGIGFAVALVLVTFLHVIFGEMVPKNLAFSMPDRAALLLVPPLVAVSRIVTPLIAVLNWTANHFVKLFGIEPKDEAESAFTLDQVAVIVDESTREGTLVDEGGTLSAALEFTAKQVDAITVPLGELVRLPAEPTPRDVRRVVAESGYSRYLVEDEGDSPTRYLHIKDVIDLAAGAVLDEPVPLERFRELPVVELGADLDDAFAIIRAQHAHLARVRATDGTTIGVLFLEDLIEELVGEVEDATSK